MKFDSMLAWQQALAAIGANRPVISPVAGVFFLVPGLVVAWFLADFQAAVFANLGNPEALEAATAGMTGRVYSLGLLALLFQTVGYMAVVSLLSERGRPTVAESLALAVKCLPSLIGAAIVFAAGLLLATMAWVAVAGTVLALARSTGLAAVLVLALVGLLAWAAARFSLTLPVIVVEGERNPVLALVRSWRLTAGNGGRIFLFYFLLGVGYLVVTMVVFILLGIVIGFGGLANGGLAAGSWAMIAVGAISGVLGAAVSVLISAVLVAIHRQLAGPSLDSIGNTFS